MNTTQSKSELFDELSYYTLAHHDPSYVHQHTVDAFIAQTADKNTKPIGLVFSLVGLYLYLEKGFTGKQVQQAHMQLARKKKQRPSLNCRIREARLAWPRSCRRRREKSAMK
jgi:hypothetical protein